MVERKTRARARKAGRVTGPVREAAALEKVSTVVRGERRAFSLLHGLSRVVHGYTCDLHPLRRSRQVLIILLKVLWRQPAFTPRSALLGRDVVWERALPWRGKYISFLLSYFF